MLCIFLSFTLSPLQCLSCCLKQTECAQFVVTVSLMFYILNYSLCLKHPLFLTWNFQQEIFLWSLARAAITLDFWGSSANFIVRIITFPFCSPAMFISLKNPSTLFMMTLYYRVGIHQKYFFNYGDKILKILPRMHVKEKWRECNSPWETNAISLINTGS